MGLLCCVNKLQPLCLCINNKQPRLLRLHEGKTGRTSEEIFHLLNSWGFIKANTSNSQPTRWRAEAVINTLSLLPRFPPTCVHSSPKNKSTVPMKPRQRPKIRSPLTAWTCADKRRTSLQCEHHAHRTNKSVIFKMYLFIFQRTHFWPSTAPWSPHSSPQRWSLHSSPSTGQTRTRLSPPQMSPLHPPAGPP